VLDRVFCKRVCACLKLLYRFFQKTNRV